jgi:hypothetical protein
MNVCVYVYVFVSVCECVCVCVCARVSLFCSMRNFSYWLCGGIAERNFSTENSLVVRKASVFGLLSNNEALVQYQTQQFKPNRTHF